MTCTLWVNMSSLSAGVQYALSLLCGGCLISSFNSSSIYHTLSLPTLFSLCVCVCVCVHAREREREMMPQLRDHTAGVPYRGPCLSHRIIFWQVDCMYGTESAPCSLGLTPIEFSLWDSWSKCRMSTVTSSSTCQEAVKKMDRDMVWQGYRWDRCSIPRGVRVE
jgi:hypothetical protein